MREEYLQFVWRFQRFNLSKLDCTSGKELTILFPGHWNKHAGPDFLEAKVRIGRKLWMGSVEIHVKSSDWIKHNHSGDPAYANVILHVVLDDDVPLVNDAGQEVPTLILDSRLDENHLEHYRDFMEGLDKLPCANRLGEIENTRRLSWLHRMAIERLEEKNSRVGSLMLQHGNDWNTVWWHLLCRAFGFGLNQQCYEMLATSISWKKLAKVTDRPFVLEAIILNQSGWIDLDKRLSGNEELRMLYKHYQSMWGLTPVLPAAWHRGRMKPANHPRVRLGQLVSLLNAGFLHWREANNADSLEELREKMNHQVNCKALNLKAEKGTTERLGSSAVDTIIVNAVIPMRFYHAKFHQDQEGIDVLLSWLEQLAAEKNRITRFWSDLDWKPSNMLESQGFIHLFHHFCSQKKCLSCLIGIQLLNEHNCRTNDSKDSGHI